MRVFFGEFLIFLAKKIVVALVKGCFIKMSFIHVNNNLRCFIAWIAWIWNHIGVRFLTFIMSACSTLLYRQTLAPGIGCCIQLKTFLSLSICLHFTLEAKIILQLEAQQQPTQSASIWTLDPSSCCGGVGKGKHGIENVPLKVNLALWRSGLLPPHSGTCKGASLIERRRPGKRMG